MGLEIPDDDRTLWDPWDDREDSGLIDDDYSDYAYEERRDERGRGNENA